MATVISTEFEDVSVRKVRPHPKLFEFHAEWMQEVFAQEEERLNRGWFPGNPPLERGRRRK